jgi:hypothetical protein
VIAKRSDLVKLLIAARDFDNQTCRDSGAMAAWRRKVDAAMAGEPGDDPAARWNAPARIEQRQRVESLFKPIGVCHEII